MDFETALTTVYRQQPCQVLPNALWKTRGRLDDFETRFELAGGAITRLQAWQGPQLFVYWSRNRENGPDLAYFDQLSFALLHQDYLADFPTERFNTRQPYFRLTYRSIQTPTPPTLPPGFHFRLVDIAREAQQVSELIGQCYPNIHPSVAAVESWRRHPVYDPALWLWVIDEDRGEPAGLGIAERDIIIGEGSLEWIQVLPSYRGLGLGKSIVQALLTRLQTQTAFITVAGEADNPSNPEALYRRCGFQGFDRWWLLRT